MTTQNDKLINNNNKKENREIYQRINEHFERLKRITEEVEKRVIEFDEVRHDS